MIPKTGFIPVLPRIIKAGIAFISSTLFKTFIEKDFFVQGPEWNPGFPLK